jgi:hypothetical protein
LLPKGAEGGGGRVSRGALLPGRVPERKRPKKAKKDPVCVLEKGRKE